MCVGGQGRAKVGGAGGITLPTFAETVGSAKANRWLACWKILASRSSLVGNSGTFSTLSVNFCCYTPTQGSFAAGGGHTVWGCMEVLAMEIKVERT